MPGCRKALAIAALALVALTGASMFRPALAGWYDQFGRYHPSCTYTLFGRYCG